MAEIFFGSRTSISSSMMVSNSDDSPVKCRKLRKRKLEMRRFAKSLGDAASSRGGRQGSEDVPGGSKRSRIAEITRFNRDLDSKLSIPPIATQELESVFGSLSVSGRSRSMEDAIIVRPNFFKPMVVGSRPLHFVGVYDGHGGANVSKLCKDRLHVFLEEEMTRENITDNCPSDTWKTIMKRCYAKMDEVALTVCGSGSIGEASCGYEKGEVKPDIVGSTAVVSVLTHDRILVANCGDSRAVLSRGGEAIPLSIDHKPDRPDELARIEAVGGKVVYVNGARVLGILAMSRALGDKYLKPIVISEPEVSITDRTPEDECLILASDGLWDVLSNEMACDVARRCLSEGSPSRIVGDLDIDPALPVDTTKQGSGSGSADQVQQPQTRSSLAAALLTRLALGRRSTDNISVIVVDLKIEKALK